MVKALRSIVVGPLERFAGGFAAELARQGYSEESAVHQLVLICAPEPLDGRTSRGRHGFVAVDDGQIRVCPQ